MTERIKRINNPLTIIAIFAALAEVNATVALGLINKDLQSIFIWFIIGFPTILIICFFVTLNFNTKVMYSPSDYKEDKSFMDSLFGNNFGNKNEAKNDSELSTISDELEVKITNKLTQKFEQLKESNLSKANFKQEIDKINIKQITDESIQELKVESILKSDLKEIMLNFFQFPAFYLLVYGIVRSKATNLDELEKFTKRFYIPKSWETVGLDRLFSENIIIGDRKSFKINEKYVSELEFWTRRNELKIRQLSRETERLDEIDNEEEKTKYRENLTRYSSRLKF